MSILKKICDHKLNEIKLLKNNFTEKYLLDKINQQQKPRGFCAALEESVKYNQFALIAELKKASPSKGVIREDFSAKNIAQAYQSGGASCLSVLTENKWFQGQIRDFKEAKKSSNLPILRKDFILDPWQVMESRSIGADCILIILAAVDDKTAEDLIMVSKDFKMDILVEVHDENELERAIKLDPDLIGINNRNLNTLSVDIETTIKLSRKVPEKYDIVCESGIETNADLKKILNYGISRFLVGESLMKNHDITDATKRLLGA